MLLLLACARVDLDGDGATSRLDCDDADAAVSPDADEVCGDDVDNNCDGAAIGCGMEGWMHLDDAGLRVEPERWETVQGAAVLDDGRVLLSACQGFTCAVRVADGAGGGVEPVLERLGYGLPIAAGAGLVYTAAFLESTAVEVWAADAWDVPVAELAPSASSLVQPIVAGDLTGDGAEDLLLKAVTATQTDSGGLWVVPGPHAGVQALGFPTMNLGAGLAVVAGDVDGDGVEDLARSLSDAVDILLGPIDPAAAPDADARIELWADALALGDTTGDGHPEVLLGSTGLELADTGVGPTGGALLCDTPLAPTDPVATFVATDGQGGVYVALPGDVDGDASADAAVVDRSASHDAVRIYAGPLVGTFDSSDARATLLTDRYDALNGGGTTAPGDVDGDGFADLLVTGQGYSAPADAWGAAWLAFGGPGF